MGNKDVTMRNNDLLDPQCCFARSVARADWHSCTWFCVMTFIANRRGAAGMPNNPASESLGLNKAAMEWPCTS